MQGHEQEVQSVLKQYGIVGITRIIPVSTGFANLNFKVTAGNRNYLYRVCTQQEHMAHIQYEILILTQLKKLNYPTAYLIPRKDGSYLSESRQGRVLVYDFIDGEEPRLNAQTASEIGHYIAVLNLFPDHEKYPRKNVINKDACLALISQFKTAPNQYPGLYTSFEKQVNELIPVLSEDLPKGLIHGDVFPDNTLFKDNRLAALIDFEEVCTDTLLMEIAMCINGFCFVDNRLDNTLLEALVNAYHKVRPITEAEFNLLTDYIRWCALGMASWHLRYYLIHREDSRQRERVKELLERADSLGSTPKPTIRRPML